MRLFKPDSLLPFLLCVYLLGKFFLRYFPFFNFEFFVPYPFEQLLNINLGFLKLGFCHTCDKQVELLIVMFPR